MEQAKAKTGGKEAIGGAEASQYQRLADDISAFSQGLGWQSSFTQAIGKSCSQYRLRIDDELNKDFEPVFKDFLKETDQEVAELLKKKREKLEQMLRGLQNNEQSKTARANPTRDVPAPDADLQPRVAAEVSCEFR